MRNRYSILIIRQIISKAISSDEVVNIFAAAGLKKPDISILADEFLAEVQGMPQRNLAVDRLQKLLKGEIRGRARRNVVQGRSFANMLEQSIRRYQNRTVETAKVIEELIQLARDIRKASERGAELQLTVDRMVRKNVRAQVRVIVKRIPRKYGYPSGTSRKGRPRQFWSRRSCCRGAGRRHELRRTVHGHQAKKIQYFNRFETTTRLSCIPDTSVAIDPANQMGFRSGQCIAE